MRITEIYFERTKSEPGFHNKKVGVRMELLGTDGPEKALDHCEKFVAKALGEDALQEELPF